MVRQPTLNEWIRIVQERFKDGLPNGIILKWDSERLGDEIADAVKPLVATNFTDFNYSRCNTFWIQLPSHQPRHRWNYTIKLSFIIDAYQAWWNLQPVKKPGGTRDNEIERYEIERRVKSLIESRGFVEMPDDWGKTIVDGVRLELCDPGDETLERCLFDDSYSR